MQHTSTVSRRGFVPALTCMHVCNAVLAPFRTLDPASKVESAATMHVFVAPTAHSSGIDVDHKGLQHLSFTGLHSAWRAVRCSAGDCDLCKPAL